MQLPGDSPGMGKARSPEHQRLGATIREVRKDRDLTLEELAHRMDGPVSVRYLAGVERGEANVSFSLLLRICKALKVEVTDLIAQYAGDGK